MEPQTTTNMLALPNELLEKIVRLLDEISLNTLAACHPRLKDICRGISPMGNIKSTHIHHVLMHIATSIASDIRSLDLSNCWTGSEEIRSLIQKFHNLSELNVVNSALTVDDLFEVLKNLTVLKKLSATITQRQGNRRLTLYKSIEEIYCEFSASENDAYVLVEFLKACPSATKLFLMVIGNFGETVPARGSHMHVESMGKYETVVIYGDPRCGCSCVDIVRLIFGSWPLSYAKEASRLRDQGIFWYERENLMTSVYGELIPRAPKPGTLSHVYRNLPHEEWQSIPVSYRNQKILGLRTVYRPPVRLPAFLRSLPAFRRLPMHLPMHRPLDVLATVVELDMSDSHLVSSAQAWQALVDSSPAVQALALASCSMLTNGAEDDALIMDDIIMKTIMKLRLKTLLVKSSGYGTCDNCHFLKLSGKLMTYISESVTLDELNFDGAYLSEDFFNGFRKPLSIRTLKMSVVSMWDDEKVMGLLMSCPKLRNLKLEARDLPISSELLWQGLSMASLKQLCLSSKSSRPIELSKLRINFFWLFKTLVIFHLHAECVPNFEEVKSLLAEEAAIANLEGRLDPVRCIVTQRSPAAERDAQGRRFLGRSLCCMENFLGIPKPIGWNFYS